MASPTSCADRLAAATTAFSGLPSEPHAAHRRPSASRHRRVWDCTPLGYELDMYYLHVRTLVDVVDHFLVAESTTTHTTDKTKPLLLSEAMARSAVPRPIAHANISVVVVDFEAERPRFCAGKMGYNIVKCMENLQRFKLVERIVSAGAPGDLALFGDADEIARPSAVSLLAQCHVFDAAAAAGAPPPPAYYILKLTLYKFGVQCDHGNTFSLGTRAFGVRQLQAHYGSYRTASPDTLARMSSDFTGTRLATRQPTIRHGGWHLTSFGEPWELQRKLGTRQSHTARAPRRSQCRTGTLPVMRARPLACMRAAAERGPAALERPAHAPCASSPRRRRPCVRGVPADTWLHANMFKHRSDVSPAQLERCMRHCLDLIDRQGRTPRGAPLHAPLTAHGRTSAFRARRAHAERRRRATVRGPQVGRRRASRATTGARPSCPAASSSASRRPTCRRRCSPTPSTTRPRGYATCPTEAEPTTVRDGGVTGFQSERVFSFGFVGPCPWSTKYVSCHRVGSIALQLHCTVGSYIHPTRSRAVSPARGTGRAAAGRRGVLARHVARSHTRGSKTSGRTLSKTSTRHTPHDTPGAPNSRTSSHPRPLGLALSSVPPPPSPSPHAPTP